MYNKKKTRGGRRNKRRKKKGLRNFVLFLILAVVIFLCYMKFSKPYTIALDAGHGGNDVGAMGIINEVELTEETVRVLEKQLKDDGRFRVVLSRKYGETKDINNRNQKLKKAKPDILLSVHGNADDLGQGRGFECYPAPPGRVNYDSSFAFAKMLGEAMEEAGNSIRGIEGIRYGYYIPNANGELLKTIFEANDLNEYDYGTFGILEGLDCPAVLAEQCFVTNQADVEAFANTEGCKRAADVYYKSICRYLGIETKV